MSKSPSNQTYRPLGVEKEAVGPWKDCVVSTLLFFIFSGWVDKDLNVHYGQPKGPQTAPNPAKRGDIEVLRLQTMGGKFDGMDGGLVYFQRMKALSSEVTGKLCVVKIAGRSVVAKLEKLRNVKKGYGEERYNLFNLIGELVEEEVALDAAHPVIWMKR